MARELGMRGIEEDPIETSEIDGAIISQEGENIVVDYGGKTDAKVDGHDSNLAENLSDGQRVDLGQRLVDMVSADMETRADWEERILQGLEIIGVKDIPQQAAAFDGASQVTHPAIAEAMVRFQANAMEELFPAEGPVKAAVVGESSPEKEAQRDRVQGFMNYQLTDVDDEYFENTDQMCMYLPYAGSAFKKINYDITDEEAVSRFIDGQHFIVPYDAKSLAKSTRYTHWYSISSSEFADKIAFRRMG